MARTKADVAKALGQIAELMERYAEKATLAQELHLRLSSGASDRKGCQAQIAALMQELANLGREIDARREHLFSKAGGTPQ